MRIAERHAKAARLHREAAEASERADAQPNSERAAEAADRATGRAYQASHEADLLETPQNLLDDTGDSDKATEAHRALAEWHQARA